MREAYAGKLKRCPKCGNEFQCMGDEDCWCENIRLHRKQMLFIAQSYTDCLCPDCLRSFESE